jgi:signal peptidase
MRFRPNHLAVIGRWTASLLCGLAVLAAVGYGVALSQGYRFFVEMSGSMSPKITTGSLILSKPVSEKDVHVGDVVSFIAPDGTGRVITHRLHSIVARNGKIGYRTKGDANPVADSWVIRFPNKVGLEQFSVPLLGYGVYALDLRPVRLVLVGLIALTFGCAFVGRLWRPELSTMRERRTARKAGSTA